MVYFLLMLAVVFMMLYAWRRIYGLNCMVQILERKLSNTQKENKELRGALNREKDVGCDLANCKKEADIIMNKIFNDTPKKKAVKHTTEIKIQEVPSRDVLCDIESVVPVIDIVSMITSDATDNINCDITTSDTTNITNIDDIKIHPIDLAPDHESVVSDVPGVYNRKKLSKMNLDKLKELCESMNLPTDGTKNMLIDRILSQ